MSQPELTTTLTELLGLDFPPVALVHSRQCAGRRRDDRPTMLRTVVLVGQTLKAAQTRGMTVRHALAMNLGSLAS
ncbi:hypothetical protein SAMN05661093_10949 [Kibdelosporangium aridum]|uniref:Uncharacterized protein n=1 Tax=Kibdelosporangium aridum TaxID=2030 RepID=A0A1W2G0D3_KIBAR|nr:hypothetical protein SAMN05661093_10949 [Kibdelosporangium aridum]